MSIHLSATAFSNSSVITAPKQKRIQLVLAGGGALTAYQLGALKILMPFWKSKRYSISLGTGISGGAVNITDVAYLVNTGQEERAPEFLPKRWDKIGHQGDTYLAPLVNSFKNMGLDGTYPNLPPLLVPLFNAAGSTGAPLQELGKILNDNPSGYWEAVQNGPMQVEIESVLIGKNGERNVITHTGKDITPETVLASAAMRNFGVYKIGNEIHEDGGYEKIAKINDDHEADILFVIGVKSLKDPFEYEDHRGIKTGQLHHDLAEYSENPDRKIPVIHFLYPEIPTHWNETAAMNSTSEFIGKMDRLGELSARYWITGNSKDWDTRSSYQIHPLIKQIRDGRHLAIAA